MVEKNSEYKNYTVWMLNLMDYTCTHQMSFDRQSVTKEIGRR